MLIEGARIGGFAGGGKSVVRRGPQCSCPKRHAPARFDARGSAKPRHDLALVSIEGPI
jgi:hypothetical protein